MLWYNENSKTNLQTKLYALQDGPAVRFLPGEKPLAFGPDRVMIPH